MRTVALLCTLVSLALGFVACSDGKCGGNHHTAACDPEPPPLNDTGASDAATDG